MIAVTSNYAAALASYSNGKIVYVVEIDGYARKFSNDPDYGTQDWLGDIDDFTLSVEDISGSWDQVSFGFAVQDRGQAITADLASTTFEGKQVTIKTGFPGLAYADFATLFGGVIDSVSSINSNLDYYFNIMDIQQVLSQVVFLTGNDGVNAPSTDNPLTLLGHPLDLAASILLGQMGLDSSLVNTAKLDAYRDGPFAGMEFEFNVTQSPAAIDFISNQLMKPLGGYVWVNSKGQVDFNFFYPLAGPVAVFEFTPDTWLSYPSADQLSSNTSRDMINTVQFQFDKDDSEASSSGNYLAQDTEEYGPSVSKYGIYGEQVIPADGLRSAFQGFFIAKLVSRLIFLRYGLKNLLIDSNAADSLWGTMRLEPGDIVAVTHPFIPNRKTGVMGITRQLFEVISKSVHFSEGTCTYSLLDASYLSAFGFFQIAPATHDDYAASSSADRRQYMFMTDDTGVYTNADKGNVLG